MTLSTYLSENFAHLLYYWKNPEGRQKAWRELKGLLLAVFIIFGVARPFIFEPYKIPSGSMIPTLLVGDFIIVSKFSYGYSRYSLPFSLPLIPTIEFHTPKTGDVVIFDGDRTAGDDLTYIKRVVGQPGDKIQMIQGVLHINGEPAPLEEVGPYEFIDEQNGQLTQAIKYIETLPNGVKHEIIKVYPFGMAHKDDTAIYTVPAGHFFMMGDNRDQSGDSRYLSGIGYVPRERILGKAQIIFYSTTARLWEIWNWWRVRPTRFFNWISPR